MRTKEKNYVIMVEFLRRTKERRLAAAIGLAVILGMTGCAGKEGMPGNPQKNVSSGAENDTVKQENTDGVTEKEQEDKNGSEVPKTQEGEWAREELVPAQGK